MRWRQPPPGHIEAVRKHLINRHTKEQTDQLIAIITQAILGTSQPEG
jgi:hypothetical protein